MKHYSAFQLNIASEIMLPAFLPTASIAPIDCIIRVDEVSPKGLQNPIKKGVSYQASPGLFWLSVPKIGRFLVENGQFITIEPDNQSDEASIRLFTMGPCLSALLLQQRKFVLHGEAMVTNEKAYAIIGHHGVGKSVLAQALLHQGHQLLSTEFCAINSLGQVLPGYPQIQLWSDAIKLLSLKNPEQRIRPALEKWYVSAEHAFNSNAYPLQKVYVLDTYNKAKLKLQTLQGVAKFNSLRAHGVHQPAVAHFLDIRQHQLQTATLVNQLHMKKIIRPDRKNTVQSLVEMLLRDLEEAPSRHE